MTTQTASQDLIDRLEAIRLNAGETKRAFSRRLRTSETSYNAIERLRRPPPFKFLTIVEHEFPGLKGLLDRVRMERAIGDGIPAERGAAGVPSERERR